MQGFNHQNLTKSQAFLVVLLFLEGPNVLKLQLLNKDFYERVVPSFFYKVECPLTTHAGLVSTIL